MLPELSNFRPATSGADVLFVWRERLNFIFWQTISVTFGKITGKLTSYTEKILISTLRLASVDFQFRYFTLDVLDVPKASRPNKPMF